MIIKLFENFNHYYTKVNDLADEMNKIDLAEVYFTEDEINIIKSKLNDRLKVIHEEFYIEINYYTKTGRGSRHGLPWISIRKFEDEWFYVSAYKLPDDPTPRGEGEYYKCDQFEGLLQLIEDKKKMIEKLYGITFENNNLKLLEDFNNYYKSLSMTDFDETLYDEYHQPKEELLEFNKEELDTIRKFIYNRMNTIKITKIDFSGKNRSMLMEIPHGEYHQPTYVIPKNGTIQICIYINNDGDEDFITIYKLPDEWYMISIYKWGDYKCDQIEGLFKCIEHYISDYYDPKNEQAQSIPTHQYYQEININEYEESMLLETTDSSIFTQKELKSISTFLTNDYIVTDFTPYAIGHEIKITNITNRLKRAYIDKYKDEWFYVLMQNDETATRQHSTISFVQKVVSKSYYKCDQIDGLLKCLNDIL